MGIKQLAVNAKGLDLRALALRIFDGGYIKTAIVDLNLDQLDEGQTATLEKLRPKYRNVSYALQKQTLNPKPGYGNPDLKVTGDFYEGFKAELRGHILEIYSTDYKAPKLEQKYANIYGLTPDNFTELIDQVILPELQKGVLNELLR